MRLSAVAVADAGCDAQALPLLLLDVCTYVERRLMAAGSSNQLAEGSWPGIRTDTDILAPLMSLDHNAPPKANSRGAHVVRGPS